MMRPLASLRRIRWSIRGAGRYQLALAGAVLVAIAVSGAALARITTTSKLERRAAPPTPTITAPATAPTTTEAPVPAPTSIPADLRANFGIFRRAQTASDLPGGALASQLGHTLPGAAINLSRSAPGADGNTYYIVPAGNGLVCLASAGGGACGAASTAASKGLIDINVCVAGNPNIRLVGLAPDGIRTVEIDSTDGSTRTANVTNNLYVTYLPRTSLPDAVSWLDASGLQVRQAINLPADASESCG